MMEEMEQKILRQRQKIDETKKEINDNIKMKLDNQNDELDSIALSIKRIHNLMAMLAANETLNWETQERLNLQNLQALNETKISIHHSDDIINTKLNALQNETFGHIHHQLDQMTELRHQLSILMNDSTNSKNLIDRSIHENLRRYDASVKELKLHFSKTEFSILSLIQKDDQGFIDKEIEQEMDLLSLGIKSANIFFPMIYIWLCNLIMLCLNVIENFNRNLFVVRLPKQW